MKLILNKSTIFMCLFAITAANSASADHGQCCENSADRNYNGNRNYNQGHYSSDRMNQSGKNGAANQSYYSSDRMNQSDKNGAANQGYYSSDRMNQSDKSGTANQAKDATITDQELLPKVQDKIGSGIFTRGYENVKVQVMSGVVTLTGFVKSQDEKDKLEKEVRDMDGVKSLNSQVTIQNNNVSDKSDDKFAKDLFATPADEQLNKKIRDNVSRGWLWDSYQDVRLNTTNGAVSIEGTVDSLNDQQKLIDEIQKVEGVKSVKSNLRILK